MVWLLTTVKQAIMRNPTGALLLTMLGVHIFGYFMMSFSFAWPAVVQSAPPPRRFFSRSSPVIDFPYGDTNGVMSLLEDGGEEFIFVMYYAPWCGRSIAARDEFDKAARYLEEEIRFVAINCWYEKGLCRQRNSFIQFPVMYFYWVAMDGIKYNGILKSDFIIQFIFLMLNPVQRLSNTAELARLIALSDTCVIGYFNTASLHHSSNYTQFRYAALRTIEKDPKNVIPYGLLTDRLTAGHLGLNSTSSIIMVRSLSSSLRFPGELNFTSSAIVQWVIINRQQPTVKWMLPSGSKSLSMSNELNRGPALIAFINAKPLSLINNHYTVLRSVALRYLNCNMTILDSIDATRFAIKQFRALGHRCRPADGSKTSPHVPFTKHCCLSLDACDACVHYHLEHPRSVSACTLVQVLDGVRTVHSDHRSCVELTNNYNGAEFYTNCCEGLAQNYTSNTVSFNFGSKTVSSRNVLHITTPDKFVSESSMRVMCKRLKLSRNVMGEKWNMNLSYRLELAGLGCRTNRTVRFYAMDMSSHYGSAFSASILGDEIDQTLSGKRTSPSAVILDIADQTVHVMREKFTAKNLADFLFNFTTNALPQFHRSDIPRPAPSGDAPSDGNLQRVVEVTSRSFSTVVMDPTKDVVLLYYTPWCGFCRVFSHIYLALARHFRSVDNMIFARINAAVNDLPWHFKIDAYPTIIFFPAGDKSESVVFPRHLSLSLSNLALFVHRVSSSTFEMRVCRPSCIRHNLDTAVSSVRRLTNRIRRIQRTVAVLRTRLGTQFNFSSFDGTEHDATTAARFPVTATPPPPSPFQQQSLEYRQLVDDVVEPVAMPIDSDMNIAISTGSFVIGDVDEELPSSSSYIPPLSSSSSAVDVTGSSADWPSVCNVTRILKTRDELATMRRRLYRYHEQLALVRYVLRVLLPVSGRTSGHLGRRHWLRLQRRRTRLALRVQNYKDYLSGSDVGSIDFR